jgi:polysaccharide export outer membrane protein
MDPMGNPLPRELNRMSLPPYVVEPPDVLQIDALDIVPKPPYRVRPLDQLIINADPKSILPQFPLSGTFGVAPEGTVNLGHYGVVQVAGLSIEEATEAIIKQLKVYVLNPQVNVALATSRALQQIRGPHLVNQDGTISLGTYGAVTVAGLTVKEVKAAIELYLSQYLLNPEVSVIVTGYNSKVFYVIFDGAGSGQSIARFPVTGSETVLDVLAGAGGLPGQASVHHIWIARPAPDHSGKDQIFPVDLPAITKRGCTATNYQVLPGDRIYVKAQVPLTFYNTLDKYFSPIERLFGTALLGVGAVQSLNTGMVPVGF